ncbi:MAG TPA: hypothetical protein VES65_00585 [Solirubrobacteraceae bacterium]|nr:hypothetical protein [Solirubrobacteraceae bacterium]
MSSEPAGGPSETAAAPGGAQAQATGPQAEPSEQELRAAYEAELSRISSAEMTLQAAVSLLNIGGYRLGGAGPDGPGGGGRDLEQVRDAIDGVRALLPILERRMPDELRPLRDALSRLQIAYAREAGAGGGEAAPEAGGEGPAGEGGQAPPAGTPGGEPGRPQRGPGPAESSGRLWVPGR